MTREPSGVEELPPQTCAAESERVAIEQQVAALGEWFQNLNLKGVQTAPHHFLGDYPQIKWRRLAPFLPENLEGKSVLEVGCNAGFYAFELKRRGAGRVLAVDADARYLSQARFAAQVLGLEVEFQQASVYDLAGLPEKFDYVLFMGLFYHLRYPVYALDMLVKKVRERMIFQSLMRGAEGGETPRSDYDFWDDAPFVQRGFPCMYFIEQSYAGDPTNWWIPNAGAIQGLLRSAGLRLLEQPDQDTWICEPDPERTLAGPVWDRELAGTL